MPKLENQAIRIGDWVLSP